MKKKIIIAIQFLSKKTAVIYIMKVQEIFLND